MAMSCVCEGMVNGQMVGSLSAELCSPEGLEVQRAVNAVLRREHSPGFTWPSRDFFAPYFPFKPKKSKLLETSIDCEELGVKSLFSLSVPRPLCLSLCVCVGHHERWWIWHHWLDVLERKNATAVQTMDKLWRGDALTTGVCFPAQKIHVSIMLHYQRGKNIMTVLKTVLSGQRTFRGLKQVLLHLMPRRVPSSQCWNWNKEAIETVPLMCNKLWLT